MKSTSSETDIKPMNKPYVTCAGDTNEGVMPCSCQDCKAVCQKPKPLPPKPVPFTILDVDGWWVIVLILYITFLVAVFIGLFINCMRRNRQSSISGEQDDITLVGRREISEDDVGMLERAGALMEEWLDKVRI